MPLTKKQQTLPKAIKDKIMKDVKPMKKQTKKDRLDEAEGKKKARKKMKQGVGARLDEAEGKKKAKKETKRIKERKY